jgi:hypothetical protein
MSCYPKGSGTGNALLAATASGKHLARVGHRLDLALAEWNKLPEKERKPGAVQVEHLSDKDGEAHWLYERAPGMLIAKVYIRPLTRNAKGEVYGQTNINSDKAIAADVGENGLDGGANFGDVGGIPLGGDAGLQKTDHALFLDLLFPGPALNSRSRVHASNITSVVNARHFQTDVRNGTTSGLATQRAECGLTPFSSALAFVCEISAKPRAGRKRNLPTSARLTGPTCLASSGVFATPPC